MKTYEYIWLDGYQPEPQMRSKVKATEDETPPDWSFDGSSTQQAEGGSPRLSTFTSADLCKSQQPMTL